MIFSNDPCLGVDSSAKMYSPMSGGIGRAAAEQARAEAPCNIQARQDRPSRVQQMLNLTEELILTLNDQVDQLARRLTPVIVHLPSQRPQANQAAPIEVQCDLAARIDQMNQGLRSLSDMIAEIGQGLEI